MEDSSRILKVLLFLTFSVHLSSAGIHTLQYLYTALINFSPVGLVDGEQFVSYDSNIKKLIPKTEWIKKVKADDPRYWERETDRAQDQQEFFQNNLATVMQSFNQTEALKVQAEIHQVPEYQVTAEELEGISLTQTDPDFTRGINPDEFARGSGSDSLADDLDLILTGASPAISRDRRVPSSPPRSGNGVIEISTTPRPARPQLASVTPVLKVCDAPQRAKRRRLVSKTASLVKRLFTDSVESPACSTREGGRGSQSVINETEAETESDNGPEPNQEAERSRRERQSPTRPLFKRRFPQSEPNASVSNQEARPERARRLRIAPPLRQRRDSGILRLAEITSDLIRDLIRDYSATFSNACEKGFV